MRFSFSGFVEKGKAIEENNYYKQIIKMGGIYCNNIFYKEKEEELKVDILVI
jgi:hypothetical protein